MNDIYISDLKNQVNRIDIDKLNNKSILVTGARGLICSYLIDMLIYADMYLGKNIKIYAMARNLEKLNDRFNYFCKNELFVPVIQDVCEKSNLDNVDFIIHGASNANPKLYVEDPIGTMNANYLGMMNLLDLAEKCNSKILYISSGDVYGENVIDKEYLCENDYGYVDLLNVRSSYASSKRAAETLCVSYASQKKVDVSIVRPAHIYGPTFTAGDSRAVSDFIRNVKNDNDIVMKSDGSSVRSYCYVGDAAVGIFKVLLFGKSAEAYNISNTNEIISIKELATTIARIANKSLIVELPTDYVSKQIDTNVKIIKMSSNKLEELGWKPEINIEKGIEISIKSII